MARIRSVKPGFFTDSDIGSLEPLARLLLLGLLTQADREGRLKDKPAELKVLCLPYDDADVDRLLETLSQREHIYRYEIDGKHYIEIRNFTEHQRPHHTEPASTLPERVSTTVRQRRKSVPAPSDNGADTVTPRPLHGAWSMEHGEGKGGGEGAAVAASRSRRKPATSLPEGFCVTEAMREWAKDKVPRVDVDWETEKFLESATAKDTRFTDWTAGWRTWMRRAVDFAPARGSPGNGAGREKTAKEQADEFIRKYPDGVIRR